MQANPLREAWRRRPVLWLLLGVDAIFVALYAVYGLTDVITDPRFGLIEDWSFGESFNYLKELTIVGLFLFMAVRRRSYAYLIWAIVFVYVLADDSTQIHERMGEVLAATLALVAVDSLRAVDVGELLWFALSGLTVLSGIVHGFRIGDRAERETTVTLGLLLVALAVFGVFLDMPFGTTGFADKILGAVEDGGEMMILSLMLWQVWTRARRIGGTADALSRDAGASGDRRATGSTKSPGTATTGTA